MLLVKPRHQLSTEPDTIRLAISHLATELPDGERVIGFGLYAVRKPGLASFFYFCFAGHSTGPRREVVGYSRVS
jgi:hypothetical protein